jgi:hypothetical protein
MQQRHPEPQRLAALLLTVALLAACTSPGPRYASWQVETPIAAKPEPGTPAVVDFHGIPVRDGQLVVSEQGSPLGMLLSLLSAEAFAWIHVGIIAIEDGTPYVYESNGQLHPTWSSEPPNTAVGGGVRRMSLAWFVANQSYIAIHEPPAGIDPAKLVAFARDSHARRVRFDPWFDLDDPGRMYCTEFVALGLVAAGAPTVETTAVHPGRSIGVLRDWLQIRTTHMIPAAALIGNSERVALISKEHSPAQTSAWFALRQELHRRFTPDQKVGNVLSFSPISGLDFQPPVRDLIRSVDVAARDWSNLTETEIDAHVRRIAGERLGPYPEE